MEEDVSILFLQNVKIEIKWWYVHIIQDKW